MVKNGQEEILEVRYTPAAGGTAGVEVVSVAELWRRMQTRAPSSRAQRPDFHVLLTVSEGVTWHMVDFHHYALADGAWLWVRPGQVQRFGDLAEASGTVVMFSSGVLSPSIAAEAALDDPFGQTLWQPTGPEAATLQRALCRLQEEFDATDVPASTRAAILQHLLAALLLRLTSLDSPTSTTRREHSETFLRFREAVEDGFTERRDVGSYARRLGYSPRTLTRATGDEVGVGAKEFIDRRVILEAKRRLAHTDDPVAIIAAALGFPDASNFVKYFSLRAGTTPTEFRRQFRSGE
ncbi:helix-turn-helix domain-containing protein [Gulosibacter molinativorax]|uniref:AraC family transcriptional regulator n=1 Tax=Gulosibacter molinativorax TaxID=256821 RepID=A0ABT7C6B0_9MICO|nr:helix-turn-helix domain-containing protein [Gulosibacter molinativorax]MDJ1370727.1 AraC family transcriptional regulator [Gulosibacter molinativorax]QUY63247.1 Putative transcriptional regulator [Gulosibacter molinativorax]